MDTTKLFDSANTVPSRSWQGTDPETAKALYGVSDVPKTKLEDLVGTEICIIGKLQMQGEKGPYFVYLYVPRQETLSLCTMAVSSKVFNDSVGRSKIPVKGIVKKEQSKKVNKEGNFNTYYILG